MRMEEGLDSGPMLVREVEPIRPRDTSSGLAVRLAEVGARAMLEGLALLEFGSPEPVEQDHDEATYAPKVSRDVARIDWARPGRDVRDHVRAMDEVPGAWTTRDGQPLKLFSPSPEIEEGPDPSTGAEPGTVVGADPDRKAGLAVLTGDGVVRFAEVQPPGRRRMAVADWLRGRSIETGDRLGD